MPAKFTLKSAIKILSVLVQKGARRNQKANIKRQKAKVYSDAKRLFFRFLKTIVVTERKRKIKCRPFAF
jgi:hypothetical protein